MPPCTLQRRIIKNGTMNDQQKNHIRIWDEPNESIEYSPLFSFHQNLYLNKNTSSIASCSNSINMYAERVENRQMVLRLRCRRTFCARFLVLTVD